MKRAWCLAAIALASCGHSLSWEYTLPAGLEGSTLVARVRAGGCSSSEIRFEAPFVDGGPAPSIPRLGSGTYGIEIEAHDASCRKIATGCTEATLPRDGAVRVSVMSVSPTPLCVALLCSSGVCAPSDAGTTTSDTGPTPDTGVDGGSGDVDAALPSECSTASDCPCASDACTGHRCVPPTAATAVSAGEVHSCAIAGGGLYCWGTNDVGELGLTYSATPLPPARVGVSSDWHAIATLSRTTLGIDGGTVRGWGSNYTGQAGVDPSTPNLFSPTGVSLPITPTRVRTGGIHGGALDASGVLWAFGENVHAEAYGAPTSSTVAPMQVGTTWRDVSMGTFFSCGIDGTGSLQCWGGDFSGQLGSADPCTNCGPVPVVVPSGSPSWAGLSLGDHTACAWDDAGTLYCWGANTGDSAGILGVGTAAADAPEPTRVPGIAVARVSLDDHACAIDLSGALWCWGPNTHGQLGDGSTTNRTQPVAIELGTQWSDVDTGKLHTCAVRADGGVFCWGNASDGATGGTSDTHVPTRVCLPFG